MSKLYAFWRYDIPPYALGGEVLKIREDNGGVYVKGYDRYMSTYFSENTIIAIVPYKEGVKLQKKLDKVAKAYRKTIEAAKKRLKDTIKDIETCGEDYADLKKRGVD